MTEISTGWVKPPFSGSSVRAAAEEGALMSDFWLPWSNFTLAAGQLVLLLCLFRSRCTSLVEDPRAAWEEGEAADGADALFILNCTCRGWGATHPSSLCDSE